MAKAPERGASTGTAGAERVRSSTRRDLVESQIFQEATRLFAERGFAGTSLQDIADATGLTRPALYHYIRSKDDILARLVTELAEEPAQTLHDVHIEPGLGTTERLRRMAYAVAFRQASHPARFQLLVRSEADLPERLIERYEKGRRRVLREFASTIADGISAGEFRPVDPRLAALSVLGQCNWVAWWHQAGTEEENHRVAAEIADLAVASLRSPDGPAADGDPKLATVTRLRRDLDHLEQLLQAEQNTPPTTGRGASPPTGG